MKNISKTEVRKLVKEVLRERWSDVLPSSIRPKDRLKEYNIYSDYEEWERDMTDSDNRYKGPELPTFRYKKWERIYDAGEASYYSVDNITDEANQQKAMLRAMIEWNKALAREKNIPIREVLVSNRRATEKFEYTYGVKFLS